MRFALSYVAATSGLGLLTLAFYGQPAVYLHQVREQWDALLASPADDRTAGPDNDAVAERMAQLQQQVARLENELMTQQALAPQAPPPVPATASAASAPPERDQDGTRPERPITPTITPPAEALSQAVTVPARRDDAGQPVPLQPEPARSEPSKSEPSKAELSKVELPKTEPPKAEPLKAELSQVEPPKAELSKVEPPKTELPRVEPLKAELPKIEPSKTEVFKVELPKVELPNVEPPKVEPPKVELPKVEPPKAEPSTSAPPMPAVQKLASVRPAPPPPPLPQPSISRPDIPARLEIDDTKSVLARLRQQPPAPMPAQQPETAPTAEPRPRLPPSPSVPRLTAARAALANGRIEDARRLLQEAQLQLVFRPVDSAGDDPSSPGTSSASRGAADVARALEALSANDLPLSRRYIDVAVNDLSGNATDTSIQQSDRRTPGYAPAYPPR